MESSGCLPSRHEESLVMYQLPFWHVASGMRKLLAGLSGACAELALAAVEQAGAANGEVYLSLANGARMTGHTRGCVSKCRRRLVEAGVLQHVRGCLFRLVVVSASKRATTQRVSKTRLSAMDRLKVLFSERIRAAKGALLIHRHATIDEIAERAKGRVLPDWSRSTTELRRRGVSERMSEWLARAYSAMRIDEVLMYVDRRAMQPGAIVRALMDGWAVA